MNAIPQKPASLRKLDLQSIFSWLLADGIVTKDNVKAQFAQAQGILKNAPGSMHPLTAVAQCKLVSELPPNRLLTLDVLTEWCAAKVGLPFIRTSPDHGTAFGLAGQGVARETSLVTALKLASELAGHAGKTN